MPLHCWLQMLPAHFHSTYPPTTRPCHPPPATPRTCNTVLPVMKAMANSPCRGCRASTHSWNALLLSLFSGLSAPDTCRCSTIPHSTTQHSVDPSHQTQPQHSQPFPHCLTCKLDMSPNACSPGCVWCQQNRPDLTPAVAAFLFAACCRKPCSRTAGHSHAPVSLAHLLGSTVDVLHQRQPFDDPLPK